MVEIKYHYIEIFNQKSNFSYFVFAHVNSFDLNISQNKQNSLWSLRLDTA